MSLQKEEISVYECSVCGAVELEEGEATCCGQRMDARERSAVFQEPELEQVAKQIFGISANELAVCKVLMAEEPTTVVELAGKLEYDRSTISRHLDHLVELELVEKEWQDLAGGGREYVYTTVHSAEIPRRFRFGLYAWTEEALQLTEELSDQKIEAMVEEAGVAGDGSGEETTDTRRANGGREAAESGMGSLIRRLFDRG